MRNEFLYSVAGPPRLAGAPRMYTDVFTGRCAILNRGRNWIARLRSLVRSRVDIERVLISEKRRAIMMCTSLHIFMRVTFMSAHLCTRPVSLFARRKIVQNKSPSVIECREKLYK